MLCCIDNDSFNERHRGNYESNSEYRIRKPLEFIAVERIGHDTNYYSDLVAFNIHIA